MTARLYSLPVSHPALAARGMLEHKGIEHRVIDIVPGMQPVVLRALRFPGHTVPALVLEGRRIQGSRAISRALDEVRPDPPLFPRDPGARRRVEEAERRGEQVLQGVPRRIFRWMAAHDLGGRRWLAVDVAGVIGGGEQPNAADFQIAGSLRSLAKFGDLEPHLAEHPAILWAATVLPALPGPVPSALPPAWLEPLATR